MQQQKKKHLVLFDTFPSLCLTLFARTGDIINTPWIKQLWQPPESPDAAGGTSADLAADLGSACCGPAMIILGPF